MVVGNGLLAQAFKQYENDDQVIIFASGVSNSKETRESEFDRENELLKSLKSDRMVVYFSTCSVYDYSVNMSQYVRHKMHMERMMSIVFPKSIIFRLPTVVGNTNNKNTFFNFFKEKVKNEETFTVEYEATRHLIDIDDLSLLLPGLIEAHKHDSATKKKIDICFNNKTRVLDIVHMMKEITQKNPIISTEFGGCEYDIPQAEFNSYKQSISYVEPENYTYNLLKKYL